MKPTDDERREVAARLCGLAESDGPYHSLDASPFVNVCSGLGIEYMSGNQSIHCSDVLLRIADLIDPEGGEGGDD